MYVCIYIYVIYIRYATRRRRNSSNRRLASLRKKRSQHPYAPSPTMRCFLITQITNYI